MKITRRQAIMSLAATATTAVGASHITALAKPSPPRSPIASVQKTPNANSGVPGLFRVSITNDGSETATVLAWSVDDPDATLKGDALPGGWKVDFLFCDTRIPTVSCKGGGCTVTITAAVEGDGPMDFFWKYTPVSAIARTETWYIPHAS